MRPIHSVWERGEVMRLYVGVDGVYRFMGDEREVVVRLL